MKTFKFDRFYSFLQFEALSRKMEFLQPALLATALVLLSMCLQLLSKQGINGWPAVTQSMALLYGIALAAQLHQPEMKETSASFHLALPVTALEKFAARWLLSFLGLIVLPFIVLLILTNAGHLIAVILNQSSISFILPSMSQLGSLLGSFLLVHSFYVWGGTVFRKSPFIKTTLAATAFGLIFFILLSVVGLGTVLSQYFNDPSAFMGVPNAPAELESIWQFLKILWLAVFPLALYAAAFFRTQENEVRG